jgi:hypothetical protein
VVIAADGDPAIAALNVLLGTLGAPGGVIRRRTRGRPCTPAGGLQGSFRTALIDSSVPWEFSPPAGVEVFRFTAWDGGGNHADWLLPAPGFMEDLTDIPTAPASARETYGIAANLVTPPAEVRSAVQFLAQADPTVRPVADVIRSRCRELFRLRAGTLRREESISVSRLSSAGKLEEDLRNGAVWEGDAPAAGGVHCELEEWPQSAGTPPTLYWPASWVPPVLPPLAAKLYQESNLLEPPVRRII